MPILSHMNWLRPLTYAPCYPIVIFVLYHALNIEFQIDVSLLFGNYPLKKITSSPLLHRYLFSFTDLWPLLNLECSLNWHLIIFNTFLCSKSGLTIVTLYSCFILDTFKSYQTIVIIKIFLLCFRTRLHIETGYGQTAVHP